MKLYDTMDVIQREMKVFGVTEFDFVNDNAKALVSSQSLEGRTLFNTHLSDMRFDEYVANRATGVKRYVLDGSDDPTAGEKQYRKQCHTKSAHRCS